MKNTLEVAKINFPLGQAILMEHRDSPDGFLEGATIEPVSTSPTSNNPNRVVVRVRWADRSETIENVDDLIPQPNLSFLKG